MKAQKFTKETIAHIGVYDRPFPKFVVGDTIVVSQRIKEGNRERIQAFQGDVIAMKGTAASRTFTVRKIGADKVYVERIFPYYAPFVENIKVIKHGDVRRSKLYYLRDRIGKRARIKEKIKTRTKKAPAPVQEVPARASAEAKAAQDEAPKSAE